MSGSSPSTESYHTLSEPREYRAPRQHGHLLAIPSLRDVAAITSTNQQLLSDSQATFAQQPLAVFRDSAQQEVLELAKRFTSQFETDCAEVKCDDHGPIFSTGHQPQFVHPGVWAKNLTVGLLAQKHNGVGLNLIVDNDVADRLGVQVPAGDREQPHFQTVPFDDPRVPMPWEEVRLQNRDEFESFAARVTEAMSAWKISPSITDNWQHAIAASSRCDCTVLPLTALRIQMERQLGINNLEIPISQLCETKAFAQFAAHIILNHEEFFESYNRAVAWYREAHGIKNDRHPVPDLEHDADRYELPFWFWRTGDTQRQRVFVQKIDDHVTDGLLELSTQDEVVLMADAVTLVGYLQELQKRGKLRTKALTTTLFMRIAVADLFVHGIGGAKYDEIADRIISDFVGIPAPKFLALSATMHLTLPAYEATQQEELDLEKQRRELHFNAEHVLETQAALELKKRKQQLIVEQEAAQTTDLSKSERRARRTQNRKRYLEFQNIAEESRHLASDEIAKLTTELELIRQQRRANVILKSREFAAVLFPQSDIDHLFGVLQAAISTEKTKSNEVI